MAILKKKQQDWLERPQQQQQQAPYAPAQSVAQAQQAYQQVAGQKPQDYVSQYQQQMQQLFGQIQDRKPFSYDLNADMLYQQYKDQYANMGKMAMQDTMGQAAALTGGYGNSYANTAGNQAYQGYLQRLNEMVPQLEDRAHARYQSEGQDLYQQYGLAAQADQTDYGRYQDSVNRWMDERSMLYGQYRDEQGFDYGQYRDAIGDSQWQAGHDRLLGRDAVADAQWQQGFDYGRERDQVGDQQWQQGFDYGRERDQVGDQRYQGEMDYRDRRDTVGDQRYAEQDAYTRYLNEQQQGNWQAQFDYGKQRDTVGDQRYQQEFDYNRSLNEQQQGNWQAQFDYGKQRDTVGDQRYAEQDAYTRYLNEQQQSNWQSEFGMRQDQFEYGKQSDQQKQDFGLAMAAIQAGQTPSAELLARAGIDKGTADLLSSIYTPKASGGSGGSTQKTQDIALNFKPEQITGAATQWKAGGDAGLTRYLENLVLQGVSPEAAATLRDHIMRNYKVPEKPKTDLNLNLSSGRGPVTGLFDMIN